jgi:hypothetical protein
MFHSIFVTQNYIFTLQGFQERSDLVTKAPQILKVWRLLLYMIIWTVWYIPNILDNQSTSAKFKLHNQSILKPTRDLFYIR